MSIRLACRPRASAGIARPNAAACASRLQRRAKVEGGRSRAAVGRLAMLRTPNGHARTAASRKGDRDGRSRCRPRLLLPRTSTRSARSRRSATCRRTCTPGRSARSATARPSSAMQLEVVPTWTDRRRRGAGPRDGRAASTTTASGPALGQPISPLRRPQAALPHRRLRRLGHRLGGRRQGEALEGRRRGRRPLQPGRRRRRGMQRRRPDVLRLASASGATRRRTAPSPSSAGCSRAS